MGMLRVFILSLSLVLLLSLGSCKTVTRAESTIDRSVTETRYNRRESSFINVSSPTVNILDELKRIGYVEMKVVNNKDTFNIKVNESNIEFEAMVSEKETIVEKVESANIETQVQVKSVPVVSKFYNYLAVFALIIIFAIIYKIWKKINT